MAFVQNYGFPYYSSPPPPHFPILPPPYHPNLPPPYHPNLPPPPPVKPPSHPTLPPPAPAKPPSHPTLPPPPPHRFPPPPTIPPPPSPGHHTTIIVVFVSLGGLFLLGFLAVALCCFLNKRKKKEIQEMEVVKVDEHLKIREALVPGPHGTQTIILSIDEDIHVEEEMMKKKKNEIVSQGTQNYHPGQEPATSSDAIIQHNDNQKT